MKRNGRPPVNSIAWLILWTGGLVESHLLVNNRQGENMQGSSIRYRDVQFPLHERIDLPMDAVKVGTGDALLFVSTDKATYIVVDTLGAAQVIHLKVDPFEQGKLDVPIS